jgi:uncharacterized protein with HEPN domain
MTQHDDSTILRQILEHAEEVLQITKDKNHTDVKNDRILSLALVRLLEIIGEAASRVSKSSREKIPQIPWMAIISMRNRLIHGYDQIDMNIVWDVIKNDLPPLINELRKILPF